MSDTIVTLADGLEHLVLAEDDYTPCGQFSKGASSQEVESTTNPCPVCFPSTAKSKTKKAA